MILHSHSKNSLDSKQTLDKICCSAIPKDVRDCGHRPYGYGVLRVSELQTGFMMYALF